MQSFIHRQKLVDAATGSEITAQAMINGTAVYSEPIPAHKCDGYAYLDMTLADTPDVDITYEVSHSEIPGDFKTPYDTDGNDIGSLATALVADRIIYLEPVIAEWIRIKFDPDANSTVTASWGHKETYGS